MTWNQERRPVRRRTSWGPTAAIIGALAVVGAALLIVPGIVAPQPTSTPTIPVASPTSALPSVAVSPYRSVRWELTPMAVTGDEQVVPKLLRVGDRLVLIGDRRTAVGLWYSDDRGSAWTAAAIVGIERPEDAARLHLSGAGSSGDRVLVSGGWSKEDGIVLRSFLLLSDDAGTNWREIPLPAQLADTEFQPILGVERGFLAFGFGLAGGTGGWWESTDGISWAPASVSGLAAFTPFSGALAAGGSGYAAASSLQSGSTNAPAIWWSEDGHNWSSVLDLDQSAFGYVVSLQGAATGFAAAGQTWTDPGRDPSSGLGTLWRSADGRHWSRLILTDEVGRQAYVTAVGDAGTIVELSEAPDSAVRNRQIAFVPTGSDQLSWVDLPVDVYAMVAIGDQFVGVTLCPPQLECTVPYLLIGTPSESPDTPPLALPGP